MNLRAGSWPSSTNLPVGLEPNTTYYVRAYAIYSEGTVYGGLYDWYEMMDYNPTDDGQIGTTRGICPEGWHIPTDEEWKKFVSFLGGEEVAGGKLKESGTSHWQDPNEGGNDEVFFDALPGGVRHEEGAFRFWGQQAVYWSSMELWNHNARSWLLYYNSRGTGRSIESKMRGCAVRCIKDP